MSDQRRPVRDAEGLIHFYRVDHRDPSTGATRRQAEYPDGRVEAFSDAWHKLVEQHRSRWGSIGYESASLLSKVGPSAVVDVMVWFHPEHPPAARLAVAQAVDPAARLGKDAPVAYVRATAEHMRSSLAFLPYVTRIVVAEVHPAQLAEVEAPWPMYILAKYPFPNSALNHASNASFTRMGFKGQGERVGIVEGKGVIVVNGASTSVQGCRVNREHEAFGGTGALGTPIVYQEPTALSCNIDKHFECAGACSFGVQDSSGVSTRGGYCVDDGTGQGVCVGSHMHEVATRIASRHRCTALIMPPDDLFPGVASYWSNTTGVYCIEGDYNAAEATLYMTNAFSSSGFFGNAVVTPSDIETAYAWLAQNEVRVVNESYGSVGFRNPSVHGLLADWYTRYHNVLFVQAAGNQQEHDTVDRRTYCMSYNGLCVGSVSVHSPGFKRGPTAQDPSRSVVPDLTNMRLDTFNLWENYSFEGGSRELEKPDLVAEGGVPHVGAVDDNNGWDRAPGGTSYASPAVVGLIAQFRHSCRDIEPTKYDDSYEIRAALMASQWDTSHHDLETAAGSTSVAMGYWDPVCQPTGPLGAGTAPLYPTADSRFRCDYKAGVGMLDARKLAIYCRAGANPTPPDDPPDDSGGSSGTVPPTGGQPVAATLLDAENRVGYIRNRTTPPGSGSAANPPPAPVPGGGRVADGQADMSSLLSAPIRGPGGAATVPAGTRVRASFAYMSCPGGAGAYSPTSSQTSPLPNQPFTSLPTSVGISDLEPAVDFDLFLVGRFPGGPAAREELIYASEALFDTEEGFDAIVPHGGFESLDIRVVYPRSYSMAKGCGGQDEPYALSYHVWYGP